MTGFDSCESSTAHQPPPTGFELHTYEVLEDEIFGAIRNEAGGIGVQGNYKADQAGQSVAGNTRYFSGYSSNLVNAVGGYYTISDGRVPAYWDIFETTGPCQKFQFTMAY